MIRMVVGRAARMAGWSFDGMDDLCLAVDQAAGFLLAAAPSALSLSVAEVDGGLAGEVIMRPPMEIWPPSDLETDMRWQILEAVCEEVWPLNGEEGTGIGWRQPVR